MKRNCGECDVLFPCFLDGRKCIRDPVAAEEEKANDHFWTGACFGFLFCLYLVVVWSLILNG